jgi:hypothetical protein
VSASTYDVSLASMRTLDVNELRRPVTLFWITTPVTVGRPFSVAVFTATIRLRGKRTIAGASISDRTSLPM